MTFNIPTRYALRRKWVIYWDILHCLNRSKELKRLIKWARGKNLPGPRKHYESRLINEEMRLFRYRIKTPKLFKWASGAHFLSNLISPTPKHLPRGSAAQYRKRLQK